MLPCHGRRNVDRRDRLIASACVCLCVCVRARALPCWFSWPVGECVLSRVYLCVQTCEYTCVCVFIRVRFTRVCGWAHVLGSLNTRWPRSNTITVGGGVAVAWRRWIRSAEYCLRQPTTTARRRWDRLFFKKYLFVSVPSSPPHPPPPALLRIAAPSMRMVIRAHAPNEPNLATPVSILFDWTTILLPVSCRTFHYYYTSTRPRTRAYSSVWTR